MAARVIILDFWFILAIFDLQVTPILPIKFPFIWPSIQKEKFKIAFQDGNCGSHLVFLIGTILAIFDLQVTSMILTKFQVNWPFGSGFPNRTILAFFFYPPVTPMLPTMFKSIGLSVQEKEGCRRSRLLKQLLTTHDGHWPITGELIRGAIRKIFLYFSIKTCCRYQLKVP